MSNLFVRFGIVSGESSSSMGVGLKSGATTCKQNRPRPRARPKNQEPEYNTTKQCEKVFICSRTYIYVYISIYVYIYIWSPPPPPHDLGFALSL